MGTYKVCVYAICKNEEKFADRWMDSMGEADLVVVLDTGSEDGTAERLRARGAQGTVVRRGPQPVSGAGSGGRGPVCLHGLG